MVRCPEHAEKNSVGASIKSAASVNLGLFILVIFFCKNRENNGARGSIIVHKGAHIVFFRPFLAPVVLGGLRLALNVEVRVGSLPAIIFVKPNNLLTCQLVNLSTNKPTKKSPTPSDDAS